MNIKERYICAYIVACLTGIEGDHPGNVEAVVENMSPEATHNPLLATVVEMVRGGSASDPAVKVVVAGLVSGAIAAKPRYRSVYTLEEDMWVFSVWEKKNLLLLAMCEVWNFEEATKAIEERFPGVEFIGE